MLSNRAIQNCRQSVCQIMHLNDVGLGTPECPDRNIRKFSEIRTIL